MRPDLGLFAFLFRNSASRLVRLTLEESLPMTALCSDILNPLRQKARSLREVSFFELFLRADLDKLLDIFRQAGNSGCSEHVEERDFYVKGVAQSGYKTSCDH